MLLRGQSAIDHPKQGMLPEHIRAFAAVARKRGEVIMVRPVSSWAKAMIADGCPTKGFAVKAKSSTWGPQCGLIPADPAHPYLSKVGMDVQGMADNAAYIKYGLVHPEPTTHLVISRARIDELLAQTDPETNAPPIGSATPAHGKDLLLSATCPSSGGKVFTFLAKHVGGEGQAAKFAVYLQIKERFEVQKTPYEQYYHPVTVFSGPTPEGGQKPLVADYDLLVVSPRWKDFDPRLDNPIVPVAVKSALKVAKKLHETEQKLVGFKRSDNPMAAGSEVGAYEESHDYGNWSVRVRDCVRDLNKEMGFVGDRECLRTVHHSADLISPFPQKIKDDLPATLFVPAKLSELDDCVWLADDAETLLRVLQIVSTVFRIPRNSAHKTVEEGGLGNTWGPEGFQHIDELERHLKARVDNRDRQARAMVVASRFEATIGSLEKIVEALKM